MKYEGWRQSLALFETSDGKFYLYNLLNNKLRHITEKYCNHLKDINCFCNYCVDEEQVVKIINDSINSSVITIDEGAQ